MIIPSYSQSTSTVLFSEHLLGKWYCSYNEEVDGDVYPRYMNPEGWRLTAHWYETKEAAEKDFQKFGQMRVDVSKREMANHKEYERLMEEDYYDSYYGQD